MATKVEEALTEIEEKILLFAPQHEGLRDFARLNLQARTLEEVNAAIVHYDRRLSALVAARVALQGLMADGHPDLATRDIDPSALADLQNNVTTIEAAFAKFDSNAASGVGLVAGPATPKV